MRFFCLWLLSYNLDDKFTQIMNNDSSHQITLLLNNWSKGDEYALEQLMPLVYGELRRMAKNYMRRERAGHTFQTTELIHEAYLKLAAGEDRDWQNRDHFFGVAAKAMRHILVDYARSKNRQKRGGWQNQITLADDAAVTCGRSEEIVALDDALNRLAELDKRKVSVVEMRFFAGLKVVEIAGVLKVSPETVKRDWSFAQTWLLRELSNQN
jgi:RNA polymerase sigma-70 factor, ECF subfamily